MISRRTQGRSIFLAAVAVGILAGTAGAATVPRIIFPVVGQVQYTDDFGAPRAGGAHQGNDIMAAKKSSAVAAEAGRVKYWTTSASAGCMLYLYGQSGTMYEYIHLNNDRTTRNDNRGKCVQGTAYAVRNGAHVAAGQLLGYVGDSGDADGAHSHLHFEVHPKGGKATDPYPYLQAAQKLLFVAKPGTPFVLSLTGTVVSASETQLQIQLSSLQAWPSNLKQSKLSRTLTVTVPTTATIRQSGVPGATRLLSAYTGQPVVVWTLPAFATLKAE